METRFWFKVAWYYSARDLRSLGSRIPLEDMKPNERYLSNDRAILLCTTIKCEWPNHPQSAKNRLVIPISATISIIPRYTPEELSAQVNSDRVYMRGFFDMQKDSVVSNHKELCFAFLNQWRL